MKIGELVRNLTLPKEVPDWSNLSIQERYQREINLNRVKKEIAPYFASDEHRFSSFLVLAVMNHHEMDFDPLSQVIGNPKLLAHYRQGANDRDSLL